MTEEACINKLFCSEAQSSVHTKSTGWEAQSVCVRVRTWDAMSTVLSWREVKHRQCRSLQKWRKGVCVETPRCCLNRLLTLLSHRDPVVYTARHVGSQQTLPNMQHTQQSGPLGLFSPLAGCKIGSFEEFSLRKKEPPGWPEPSRLTAVKRNLIRWTLDEVFNTLSFTSSSAPTT